MDEQRRRQYLAAMGVTVWCRRVGAQANEVSDRAQAMRAAELADPVTPEFEPPPARSQEPPAWLDEPPPWRDDEPVGPGDQAPVAKAPPVLGGTGRAGPELPTEHRVDTAALDWPELEAEVATCRRCGLHETRTNTVFGVGDRQATLMLIGEGPGHDEDQQGEPFVGRAGQLLNKMLAAIGLTREQVYIANIVKCRPPGNRNPATEEASACRGYLERQIALIQPDLIVSLGGVSANNLLNSNESVGRLRNRTHHYRRSPEAEPIPLVVTYHPSYYLRSPAEKAKGWKDLQQIARTLQSGTSS